MSNNTKNKRLNEKETTGIPQKDGKYGFDDSKEFTAEDFDKINADNGFILIKFANEGTFVCTHLSKEITHETLFNALSQLSNSFGFTLFPFPEADVNSIIQDIIGEEDGYYDDDDDDFLGHLSSKPDPS